MSELSVHSEPTTAARLCNLDAWLDDDNSVLQKWDSDIERLFCDFDEVRVKVIDVGKTYCLVRDQQGLFNALCREKGDTRIILIPQEFSWGSLQISEKCMRTVLEYLDAFPAFLDVLHIFGERTWASNESRGCYASRTDEKGYFQEHCYLLKCVELHGREGVDDPWSIRNFAVYEKEELSRSKSDFVIINPSAPRMLRDKLITLQKASRNLPSRKVLHLMMLQAASTNWPAYVDWLEAQLHPLTSKAYVAASSCLGGDLTVARTPVDMMDMQNLQIIQDKIIQANHLLEINGETAKCLAGVLWELYPDERRRDKSVGAERMESYIFNFHANGKRLTTLLSKANSVSGLMQNLISTRALETLHNSSNLNARMAQLAQEDNKIMLSISEEGRKDGRTLKTITVLTLAYLPASFVSTLLSMGYVYVKGNSLKFKPEMWIFGVLSVLLILLTFGLWFTLDLRRNRRQCDTASSRFISREKGTA